MKKEEIYKRLCDDCNERLILLQRKKHLCETSYDLYGCPKCKKVYFEDTYTISPP